MGCDLPQCKRSLALPAAGVVSGTDSVRLAARDGMNHLHFILVLCRFLEAFAGRHFSNAIRPPPT
jgi:hypothetical protein